MFLYGGPGSQKVLNKYEGGNFYWYQMLAQKGYVIACVDNRGTGGKGAEFKKMTYKQLGKYETIDQIDAAKYFGNLKYIDQTRIGIQGWSYGGYMSSLAITKGADIFSKLLLSHLLQIGVIMIIFIPKDICRLHKKIQKVMTKIHLLIM